MFAEKRLNSTVVHGHLNSALKNCLCGWRLGVSVKQRGWECGLLVMHTCAIWLQNREVSANTLGVFGQRRSESKRRWAVQSTDDHSESVLVISGQTALVWLLANQVWRALTLAWKHILILMLNGQTQSSSDKLPYLQCSVELRSFQIPNILTEESYYSLL